ncbi:Putative G. violaceus kinesin [Aspergillus calidoustus]|uniref:Putative G. violaceus kinesin n=1 Tax=Aspergillus calidoustus TaxID=454130 RepID=A0A0U5FUQ1_ASPCI|nr:Putative G. violaceus kinesin [Aspergillus calidoustus]
MLYPSQGTSTTLDALCRSGRGGLAAYIPESPRGSVLVTTRNKQVAVRLTKNQSIIELRRMNKIEADELLRTTLDGIEQEADNRQGSPLAARLEYLPLALVQAAAYIRMNSMSVDRYLELLDNSEDSLVELLNKNFDAVGRDPDTPHAVAATWMLSFQKIEQQSPLAGEVLSLLCFFDRQAIPMEFVYHCQQQQQDRGYQTAIRVEEAVGLLKAFSFITSETDPNRLAVHRLVQLVTRRWLVHRGTAARFAQLALRTVSDLYPYGSYETRVLCSAYLPHAFAVLRFVEEANARSNVSRSGIGSWLVERFTVATSRIASLSVRLAPLISRGLEEKLAQTWAAIPREWRDESSTTQSTLCHNAAGFCLYQGRFGDAEALQLQALKLRREILGEENLSTLDSQSNLASTYARQGRWAEAAALLQQLIAVEHRVLGAEDPSTLTSMDNLASAYWNLGQWSMAEDLNMQVVAIRKRVLGEEHLETLTSMANLASIYWDQGRCGEAEALEVQVMETRRRILGDVHPSTLTSMANLASTYWSQGRCEDAEALEVRVVEVRKKVLGAEHPDTLTSMANLATTYSDQERWKEAEELEAQVLETRKKTLGDQHPSTLTSMANLASTYWEQGWWAEAEQLEKYVFKTRKLVLGEIHPDTLTSMANLSQTWRSQGRFKEATGLMRECFGLRKQLLGADHADTQSCSASLSDWQGDSDVTAQDLTDS